MSSALAKVAPLKAEIRLMQATKEFEADLSDEQKKSFLTNKSQSCISPPNIHDVMRLTAEIDRRISGKLSGRRGLGPRLTNILQAVQQFAALGDIIIGGSQNMIACGVWSLVRLTLLVGLLPSYPFLLKLTSYPVARKLLFLPRKVVDSSYDRRSIGSPLRKDGLALSPVQGSAVGSG